MTLDAQGVPDLFSLPAAKRFNIPTDAGVRIALVDRQLRVFQESDEVLLWIAEWGVWPSSERPHIFERVRKSYGIDATLMEKPGHLVKTEEWDDLATLTTVAALFLWDCYVLEPSGKRAVRYSHDEIGHSVGTPN